MDAATNKEKKSVGLGVVARDSTGKFVAAAVKTSQFHGDVTFAEAEAVEWGLQLAKTLGVSSIIVETDSQTVSNLLNSKAGSRTEVFWVISEVQDLAKEFGKIRIQYIPRICNAHAHLLAKSAFDYDEPAVWMGTFPENILYLLQSLNE